LKIEKNNNNNLFDNTNKEIGINKIENINSYNLFELENNISSLNFSKNSTNTQIKGNAQLSDINFKNKIL